MCAFDARSQGQPGYALLLRERRSGTTGLRSLRIVERDGPNEVGTQSVHVAPFSHISPVPPVSLSYPADKAFLVSISNRS